MPTDRTNLVCKAVELLARSASVAPDVHIALDKHIPAAGGLGGGSSDAAATLRGLNRLWNLGLSEADLLASAYRNSLALAEQNGIRTLAFPAISCGIYGYPLEEAAGIAVQTVRDSSLEVTFVLFTAELLEVFRAAG